MNRYGPDRRASSVCDSVFFSSLFLFFRAFYQSHRNCPIMDSNQRGVHNILLFFFFVEARSASRIPNCSTGCSLSPFSLRGFTRQSLISTKHYGVLSLHCIYTHDAIHPLAFIVITRHIRNGSCWTRASICCREPVRR